MFNFIISLLCALWKEISRCYGAIVKNKKFRAQVLYIRTKAGPAQARPGQADAIGVSSSGERVKFQEVLKESESCAADSNCHFCLGFVLYTRNPRSHRARVE